MYIAVPPEEEDDTYAFNILGDELMHSYQFEVGDIGFEAVPDGNGGVRSAVTGYDKFDEIESKNSSIQAAKNNGVDLVGSSKDYNKKVNEKNKMTAVQWIDTYKSKDGTTYKGIIGDNGMAGKMQGYLSKDGTDVRARNQSGANQNYVYRRKDGQKADGTFRYKSVSPNTNNNNNGNPR